MIKTVSLQLNIFILNRKLAGDMHAWARNTLSFIKKTIKKTAKMIFHIKLITTAEFWDNNDHPIPYWRRISVHAMTQSSKSENA